MRTLATLGTAALVFTLLGAPPAAADPAIPLNGGQEAAAGDEDGHGFFSYTLDGTSFCYTLSWHSIDTALAAHVHKAPRNVAGSVVIPLSVGDGSGTTVSACTVIGSALAADLAANPKSYYVNVHNPAFPAGAIRGQLK